MVEAQWKDRRFILVARRDIHWLEQTHCTAATKETGMDLSQPVLSVGCSGIKFCLSDKPSLSARFHYDNEKHYPN